MNVGLVAIHGASFGRSSVGAARTDLLEMWGDRLAWAGVQVDPERYVNGLHNSFTAMSLQILDVLCGSAAPELIVIAHGTPDADARVSLAGTLSRSGALVLAVSDQGRLAPFTALRLASGYPERPRALIIALDQGTATYADPELDSLDRNQDHAVGLLVSANGGALLNPPVIRTDIAPDEVGDVLAAELSLSGAELLITGRHVPVLPSIRTVRAAPEQLSSAVWNALAGELRRPDPDTRIIAVAEYEPSLRSLAVLVLDIRPGPPVTGHTRAGATVVGGTS